MTNKGQISIPLVVSLTALATFALNPVLAYFTDKQGSSERITKLETEIPNLKEDVTDIKNDVRDIKSFLLGSKIPVSEFQTKIK